MLEDPKLTARIRARDPEALQSVVQSNLLAVLRTARIACLDADVAEDVAQATFATFLERADRFQGRSQVRTWLFGILYKKIAETRRKQTREAQSESFDEILEYRFNNNGRWMHPPRPVDLQLYDAEVRQALEGCLKVVSSRQRAAFILREVEGFGSADVCEIMKVTRTNLGSLLCRARMRLRECLEARDVRA